MNTQEKLQRFRGLVVGVTWDVPSLKHIKEITRLGDELHDSLTMEDLAEYNATQTDVGLIFPRNSEGYRFAMYVRGRSDVSGLFLF